MTKHFRSVKHSIVEIAIEKHIRSLYLEGGIEVDSLIQKRPFYTEIEIAEAILFPRCSLPSL